MKRSALLLPLCLLASGAGATSWVTVPPHDPAKACHAIEAAVAEMTGKKAPSDLWPLFVSDAFGLVDAHERAAFIRSMTSAEGKPDKAPIAVTGAWPVGQRKPDDAKALYVVGLQRDRWFPEREGSIDPMQAEPAGYQPDIGYWLAAFSGDRIVEFREGRSYFGLVDPGKRLKGCGDR